MTDLGKYPLDDDELEMVSGGATQDQNDTCGRFSYEDPSGPPTCSNCTRYNGGQCRYIK